MSPRSVLAALGLLASVAGSGVALAQAPASSAPANPFAGLIRFGGTVTSASAGGFVVHSDQGDVKLSLPASVTIMVSGTGTVADLATGKFVGCTAVKRADNLMHATECHIFPESMRGTGEGHNPMGPPNTTMTNGSVTTVTANGEVASKTNGSTTTINVTYKAGQQTIQVGPDASITKIMAGTPAMVKPGAKVQGAAKPAGDGPAQVAFISLTP